MYRQSFAKITLILKNHSAPINSCHNYKLLSDSQITNSNEKYNIMFIRIKRTLWTKSPLSTKHYTSDDSDDSDELIKTSLIIKYPSKYHIFNIFEELHYTEKLKFDTKMEIKFMTVFYLSELFKFILKNDISICRISPDLNSIILQELIIHDKIVELTNLTTLNEVINKLESCHNSEQNTEHPEESQIESEHNENLADLANITKFIVNQKLSDLICLYTNLFNHSSLELRPLLIENLNLPEQPIESDENVNLDEETYNIKNSIDEINELNRKYIDENNDSTERKPSRIEEIYNYIKQQNSTEYMNISNEPNNSKLTSEFILLNRVQLSNEGFKMMTTKNEQLNENSNSDESQILTDSTEASDLSLNEQQTSTEQQTSNEPQASTSAKQQNSNEPQNSNSNEQQTSNSTESNT